MATVTQRHLASSATESKNSEQDYLIITHEPDPESFITYARMGFLWVWLYFGSLPFMVGIAWIVYLGYGLYILPVVLLYFVTFADGSENHLGRPMKAISGVRGLAFTLVLT